MNFATLSSKNQIVVPRDARRAMNVKPGDKLLVVTRGNMVIILPKPEKYSQALKGLGKGIYGRDYLRDERKSWR